MKNQCLVEVNDNHLHFLKSIAQNKPEWIFGDWSSYPGISWKLKNLKELEKNNKTKFQEQINSLLNIKGSI